MTPGRPDRREFQRIELERPIVARFGDTNVLIVNIGVAGALFEHHGVIKVGEERRLSFRWSNLEIVLTAETVRTYVHRFANQSTAVYHTGARFVAAFSDSDKALRQLIAFYVERGLAIQKANARGIQFDDASFRDPVLSRALGGRTDSTRGYIAYRYIGNRWQKAPTTTPVQPHDGFTVAAAEVNADVLCRSYEEADENGRGLIRMLAELSVSETRQIPPRK